MDRGGSHTKRTPIQSLRFYLAKPKDKCSNNFRTATPGAFSLLSHPPFPKDKIIPESCDRRPGGAAGPRKGERGPGLGRSQGRKGQRRKGEEGRGAARTHLSLASQFPCGTRLGVLRYLGRHCLPRPLAICRERVSERGDDWFAGTVAHQRPTWGWVGGGQRAAGTDPERVRDGSVCVSPHRSSFQDVLNLSWSSIFWTKFVCRTQNMLGATGSVLDNLCLSMKSLV